MSPVTLAGVRADNPLGFLVALGVLDLLTESRGPNVALGWIAQEAVSRPVVSHPELGDEEQLVTAILAAHARRDLARELAWGADVNKVSRLQVRERLAAIDLRGVASGSDRVTGAVAAELPSRRADPDVAPRTPFCLFPIKGRRSFLGTLYKQSQALDREQLRDCLFAWRQQQDVNTLRLDPAARIQENAIMAADPSAAGVVGVPAAAPLAIRGLTFYCLMPTRRAARPAGFAQRDRFAWPIWERPLGAAAVRLLLGSPWVEKPSAEGDALLRAHGVAARFAATRVPLKEGSMFSWGRREL